MKKSDKKKKNEEKIIQIPLKKGIINALVFGLLIGAFTSWLCADFLYKQLNGLINADSVFNIWIVLLPVAFIFFSCILVGYLVIWMKPKDK